VKVVLYFIPNLTRAYGGIYQYSLALLKALLRENNPSYLFIVLCTEPGRDIQTLSKEFGNIKIITSETDPEPFIKRFARISSELVNIIYKRLWSKIIFRERSSYEHIINKYNVNVVHCPYQSLLYPSIVPTISTLHDVQELRFPEFFTSSQRIERAINFDKITKKSDAIIVSYSHIKKDIIKYFKVSEHLIHVCFLALKDLWIDNFSETDIMGLEELSLPENFIFYPAATWEHKNHIRLLEALKLLRDCDIIINAVFTGHKTDHFKKIEKKIIEWNLEHQVFFLGLVEDKVLYSIYKKATAVVIPSLYEAGSFPLMESMLLNIPVICSNITSLPETIGNSAFTFDPYNIEEIAKKIELICFNKVFRKDNQVNSKEKSPIFRNYNVSKKIFSLYDSFL